MESGLNCLRPGTWAVVTGVGVQAALAQRLQEFGLVPGTAVCCRYKSPGGSITAVECRGAVLALRSRDAAKIRVVQQ